MEENLRTAQEKQQNSEEISPTLTGAEMRLYVLQHTGFQHGLSVTLQI